MYAYAVGSIPVNQPASPWPHHSCKGLLYHYQHNLRLAVGVLVLFLLVTGRVSTQNGTFVPTSRGRYYLVGLMKEFFGGVNRLREFLGPESGT